MYLPVDDEKRMLHKPDWLEDYWIASAPEALRRARELRKDSQAREWEFRKVESISNTQIAMK